MCVCHPADGDSSASSTATLVRPPLSGIAVSRTHALVAVSRTGSLHVEVLVRSQGRAMPRARITMPCEGGTVSPQRTGTAAAPTVQAMCWGGGGDLCIVAAEGIAMYRCGAGWVGRGEIGRDAWCGVRRGGVRWGSAAWAMLLSSLVIAVHHSDLATPSDKACDFGCYHRPLLPSTGSSTARWVSPSCGASERESHGAESRMQQAWCSWDHRHTHRRGGGPRRGRRGREVKGTYGPWL